MDAEMTVGFMSFEESYVSKVTCKPHESVQVSIHLIQVANVRHETLGSRFVVYTAVQNLDNDVAVSTGAARLAD